MTDDPCVEAERRLQLILDTHPEILNIPVQAERILSENTRFLVKSARLYRLADAMKAMLEPYVVCGSGCSYCCHMPTMIYQHEADAMAKAAQCTALQLRPRLMPLALHAARAFSGQPCPFLEAGRCSIYEHRPLICRLHNSLNSDPQDCRIPETGGEAKPILSVDPDYVEMPYHQAVQLWNPREPWGAIQEYFPKVAR